jgi:hypothetical protein
VRDYYVYGLFRPDNGQVFYIGLGRGDRAWQHAAKRRRGRSYKDNVLCQLIDDRGYPCVPVVVLRNHLTRDEAAALETALIYAIGRHPHGPLTNAQDGGYAPPTRSRYDAAETAALMRERIADPAYQRMLALRTELAWPTLPDNKEHVSVHWTNWWNGF